MNASKRPWWELVDPALVERYVALVKDTRHLQRYYRRTLDPSMRRELPPIEDQVDRLTDELAAAIAAAKPAELVEGGVS